MALLKSFSILKALVFNRETRQDDDYMFKRLCRMSVRCHVTRLHTTTAVIWNLTSIPSGNGGDCHTITTTGPSLSCAAIRSERWPHDQNSISVLAVGYTP